MKSLLVWWGGGKQIDWVGGLEGWGGGKQND